MPMAISYRQRKLAKRLNTRALHLSLHYIVQDSTNIFSSYLNIWRIPSSLHKQTPSTNNQCSGTSANTPIEPSQQLHAIDKLEGIHTSAIVVLRT